MRVTLAAVAVSGVHRDGSRVHTHDHDGSKVPDESPNSILLSEPKPLRKHRPPPPPSITVLHMELILSFLISRSTPLRSPYRLAVILRPTILKSPLVFSSRTLPDLVSSALGCGQLQNSAGEEFSDSGISSLLRSTGGLVCIEVVGSWCSGGHLDEGLLVDGNGAVSHGQNSSLKLCLWWEGSVPLGGKEQAPSNMVTTIAE
ncbi:hypothetical protein Tco_1539715 [Tanacetum coccineum]